MKVWQPHLLLLSPVRLSHSLRPSALSPDSLEPPGSGSVSAGRHPPDDLHGVLRFSLSLHPFRQDHLPRLSFPILPSIVVTNNSEGYFLPNVSTEKRPRK